MRRLALLVGGAAAATLLSSALPATAVTGTSATAPATSSKLVHTPFAFTAGAFGTQVRGGQLPAGSDMTAYANISCQNSAGINKSNHIAAVKLPGLGTVNGVDSHVWTTKSGNTVASNAEHTIAGVTLLDSGSNALKLAITGVESRAKAWHDATGFHATTSTSLAGISLTLAGVTKTLKIPTLNHPLVVPNVLKIEVGAPVREQNKHHILVRASTLKISLLATGTEVRLAQTRAGLSDGIRSGLFGGFGAALRASVLNPVLTIGRTPNQPMACRGTRGQVRNRATATVNIPGVATVNGVADQQMAYQTKTRSYGYQQAQVAGISLLGGRVQITGVKGRVNVRRTPKGLTRNTNGTRVLSITVDGQAVTLPDLGKLLTIPGLLSIQQGVTTKIDDGLQVIALQVKLLDGTGATIDLGVARLRIHKAA
jgi:hypothetical protein